MIPVSRVWYPDKQRFLSYIDRVYESGWLTNNGPLVQELEKRLEVYLGVKNLLCVANGSIALQMACKLLKLKGEVVTTPFSYVATTDSIVAECLTPVFSDIDQNDFNMDPDKIENAITDKTSAIMPVHVFGNACNVEKIDKIAKKNRLKVIYDGSHIFGVKYKERSLLDYGDISTISFNAVKLFHTAEGGALIIQDDALYEEAKAMRQYGTTAPDGSESKPGINAKMNELEAAMGLAVLDEIEEIRGELKRAYLYYASRLKDLVKMQKLNENATYNYSYFPIILDSVETRKAVQEALLKNGIKPRRYFYPSLDTLSYVEQRRIMTVSHDITSKILVLPLHSGAEVKTADVILEIFRTGI